MKVEVSTEMHSVCPVFVGACITANIMNTEYSAELWREIDALSEEYRATLTTESLKQMESIQATRRIYKLCGKDPSRYRRARLLFVVCCRANSFIRLTLLSI